MVILCLMLIWQLARVVSLGEILLISYSSCFQTLKCIQRARRGILSSFSWIFLLGYLISIFFFDIHRYIYYFTLHIRHIRHNWSTRNSKAYKSKWNWMRILSFAAFSFSAVLTSSAMYDKFDFWSLEISTRKSFSSTPLIRQHTTPHHTTLFFQSEIEFFTLY